MTTRLILAGLIVLLSASTTLGQQSAAEPRITIGFADLGVSSTDISGDAARFQRFRDMRDRGSLERLQFDRQWKNWTFESSAEHLGRTDQRMFARVIAPRVKASFTWDQIPFYISAVTRSPFTVDSSGAFRLDDALQLGIQNGQLGLPNAAASATGFDLRSRRHVAAFDLVYSASRAVDLTIKLRETRRDGSQPFGAAIAMSNTVELAAPIDSRTRDITAQLEWASAKGRASVGYDGSWFENRAPALVWDNPINLADAIVSGTYRTGQGRTALWPNSSAHGATAAGSVTLPGKTRVSAQVRTGMLWQNQQLLPMTINSAIPAMPLPRGTAQGEARTLAMNYVVTSRPAPGLWLNARYRYYDFDNRTPVFAMAQRVSLDQTVTTAHPTEPIDYTRNTLDVDAAVTPFRFSSFRAGYTHGIDDRSFRIFTRTIDDVYRASVDSSYAGFTLRAIVERGQRRGLGFDEEALTSVGEQPGMRHYDVADRDRNRVTGLLQWTPHKVLAFSVTAADGKDAYTNSGFGLRDNKNRTYSATVDVVATDRFAAAASYTRERYNALQNSRNVSSAAVAQDATRDWSFDSTDRADTVSANVDLVKLIPRTDIRVTYDQARATTVYLFRAPFNSTLAPLVQLPTVRNQLRTATGEVRFFVTRQLALGALYWYDDYAVDDFQRSVSAIGGLAQTGALFLGSLYQPYTAKSASLRIMWIW